jgi:hypothetical protein
MVHRPVIGKARLGQTRVPKTANTGFPHLPPWSVVCLDNGMSTLAFKVNSKNGEYVKPMLIPSNHSKPSRFGPVDVAIAGFFLLCVGGLIYLLLQN